MSALVNLRNRIVDTLDPAGHWFALLPIRLLMAWEYGRAGMMKYNGNNWFANVQDNFPFPFNIIPVEISWFLATWAEILGGVCLLLGLFTRFWAFSLIILTIVAIAGVHWPDQWDSLAELWKGYTITDKGFGNYRVPLLFMAMLFPLVFAGGGKFSLDHVLFTKLSKR
ncbi:MAG: DoxX family protein [Gammaproteobacteria bacterium]|nr:DoxX family protein [Gammaproteobacteria bacterium]MDH3861913.1 DoxX family protein [Gammaproteobacteria bacterium]